MNVLFLTLNSFSSIDERGIYTDLMREFVNNNHKVWIITPSERRKKEPTELITDGNLNILKLKIGNIQKTNLLEKGITTITLETKFKNAISKFFHNVKFDLVIYSTPPITLQKAVEYVKKRDSASTYLLLKDIFPQNAVDLGMLDKYGGKGIIYKFFRRKEKKLYKISDYIGCMSDENVNYVRRNNPEIKDSNIEVCPNSISPINVNITTNDRAFVRNTYGIPLNKKVFIYGGNLGKPQGIDFLKQCIEANEENEDSFFLIVGSGTEFKRLDEYFSLKQPRNAKLLSYLPKKDYDLLANSCDVGLIFLDNKFTIPNFPSRMLSYMQASIPILAATDSSTDVGKVIRKGKFGLWCESKSANEFNNLVLQMCNEQLIKEFGKNAREYLENNYTSEHSYRIIMNHFK